MSERKGTSHQQQIHRLNRVAGQVKGVVRMIDEERYCVDILNQIKAIKSALCSVEKSIIDEHMSHCVHAAIHSKNKKLADKMLEEIGLIIKAAGV